MKLEDLQKEYNNLQVEYFRIKSLYENLKIDFKMLEEVNNKYYNIIEEALELYKKDPELENLRHNDLKRKLLSAKEVEIV